MFGYLKFWLMLIFASAFVKAVLITLAIVLLFYLFQELCLSIGVIPGEEDDDL